MLSNHEYGIPVLDILEHTKAQVTNEVHHFHTQPSFISVFLVFLTPSTTQKTLLAAVIAPQ